MHALNCSDLPLPDIVFGALCNSTGIAHETGLHDRGPGVATLDLRRCQRLRETRPARPSPHLASSFEYTTRNRRLPHGLWPGRDIGIQILQHHR